VQYIRLARARRLLVGRALRSPFEVLLEISDHVAPGGEVVAGFFEQVFEGRDLLTQSTFSRDGFAKLEFANLQAGEFAFETLPLFSQLVDLAHVFGLSGLDGMKAQANLIEFSFDRPSSRLGFPALSDRLREQPVLLAGDGSIAKPECLHSEGRVKDQDRVGECGVVGNRDREEHRRGQQPLGLGENICFGVSLTQRPVGLALGVDQRRSIAAQYDGRNLDAADRRPDRVAGTRVDPELDPIHQRALEVCDDDRLFYDLFEVALEVALEGADREDVKKDERSDRTEGEAKGVEPCEKRLGVRRAEATCPAPTGVGFKIGVRGPRRVWATRHVYLSSYPSRSLSWAHWCRHKVSR